MRVTDVSGPSIVIIVSAAKFIAVDMKDDPCTYILCKSFSLLTNYVTILSSL